MSDETNNHNGVENGDVPEIELIIKVKITAWACTTLCLNSLPLSKVTVVNTVEIYSFNVDPLSRSFYRRLLKVLIELSSHLYPAYYVTFSSKHLSNPKLC